MIVELKRTTLQNEAFLLHGKKKNYSIGFRNNLIQGYSTIPLHIALRAGIRSRTLFRSRFPRQPKLHLQDETVDLRMRALLESIRKFRSSILSFKPIFPSACKAASSIEILSIFARFLDLPKHLCLQ